MNWLLRGILGGVPHDGAPERNPFKVHEAKGPEEFFASEENTLSTRDVVPMSRIEVINPVSKGEPKAARGMA